MADSGPNGTPASPRGAARRTAPILVIEDEPDFRTTYERLLRRLQYDVITAERGAEGLRIAESQDVGLIVTDLKLPDVDGLAIVRALRARPNPPPIIVVSGLTSAATQRAALDAGAAAYLTKPFSISAFTSLIRNVLNGLNGKAS